MLPRLFAILLLFTLAAPHSHAASRPNVLLIVSDDQGWLDLGCIGTKPVLTPNLDRLATEGVRDELLRDVARVHAIAREPAHRALPAAQRALRHDPQ